MKVRNLKANHSNNFNAKLYRGAVLATVKVRNLKANHSVNTKEDLRVVAVLATVKVRNLKANHSAYHTLGDIHAGCISYCESTKSES